MFAESSWLRRQFLEWPEEPPGTAIGWPTAQELPLLAPGCSGFDLPDRDARSRPDALVRILEESPQLGKRACAAGPILPRADAAWRRTDASASDSRPARSGTAGAAAGPIPARAQAAS